ncbi:MAG TPA: AAA family ATPase, partial [Exilispira sp.]|nr:AAA family ATPase [Exilispira sp.]
MLKRIYVKNYALINEISIEFDSNYSIISGETGAGKSILINSLLLASGEAIDTTFVLDKENPVIVEVTISNISQDLLDKALEFGVEFDGLDLTVKRVYNPKLLKNSYYMDNVSV